jgi:DNA-binding PadR family transcriptional regulator
MEGHRGGWNRGGPWTFEVPVRGGGRRRRGDIRTAVLAMLAEAPAHGYELIQRLEEKTQGAWRPSAGSIYPTLQLLEDEGLVRSEERDGKRVYELTDEGRTAASERMAEAGGPPWAGGGGSPGRRYKEFGDALRQLHLAAKQVAMTGDQDQISKVSEIITEARKKIYMLLADA